MPTQKSEINDALYLAAGYSIDQNADLKIRPLAEMERFYIETVINLCGGSIPRASALLQVSPSTIYRKKATWGEDTL
jgi:DNA-binding NtrC family response regulator